MSLLIIDEHSFLSFSFFFSILFDISFCQLLSLGGDPSPIPTQRYISFAIHYSRLHVIDHALSVEDDMPNEQRRCIWAANFEEAFACNFTCLNRHDSTLLRDALHAACNEIRAAR
jgi:hypothetical protein